MRIKLVFFFFIALALKAVGQNEVQQLYPCLNDSSEVIPGCVAISLGYGQYCEAVRDTSYCSGDTLFTKYVAANSFLAISQGDSVYIDTLYNGCSGGGSGEWTDNGLSIYPTEKTDSVIIGDSVSYGFGLFEVYGKSYFDDDIRINDYTTGTGTYLNEKGYATFRGFNTIFEFSTASSFFNIEADQPGDAISILLQDDDNADDAIIDFNTIGERFIIFTDATDDRFKIGNGNFSTFNGGIEFIDDDVSSDAGEIYLSGYENSDSLTDNSGYNPLMINLSTGKVEPGANASNGGEWTDLGSVIHPTESSDQVVIGGTSDYQDRVLTVRGETFFDVSNGYFDFKDLGRMTVYRTGSGASGISIENGSDQHESMIQFRTGFEDFYNMGASSQSGTAVFSMGWNSGGYNLSTSINSAFKYDYNGDIFFPQYNGISKIITSQTNKYVSMIDTTNGQMFLIHPDSIGGTGGGGGSADGNDFLTDHSVTGASGTNSRTLTSTVSNQPDVTATINVADADSSTTNEIQTLSIDSTASDGTFRTFTISLTDGESVSFNDSIGAGGGGGSDGFIIPDSLINKTNGSTERITFHYTDEVGNQDSIFTTFTDDTGAGGTDDQTLSLDSTATSYSLTIESGNTVYWIKSSDSQTLSHSAGTGGNDEITISNGNTITITDDVDDADADATNEFQTMSIDSVGRKFTLTLTDGNSVSWIDSIGEAGTTDGNDFVTSISQSEPTDSTVRLELNIPNQLDPSTTFSILDPDSEDDNGIYDGSGTVPTSVDVSLTDNISFADSVFQIDGTNRNIQTDDTLYFGDKWTMFASNDGDSLSIQSLNPSTNFRIFGDGGEEFFDLNTAIGALQLYGYRTASVANRDDAIQQVAHFTSTGSLKRTSVEVLADSIEQYLPAISDDQTLSSNTDISDGSRLNIEDGGFINFLESDGVTISALEDGGNDDMTWGIHPDSIDAWSNSSIPEKKDTVYFSLTHTFWNDTINNEFSEVFYQVPPSQNGWIIKEFSTRTFTAADQDLFVQYSIMNEAGSQTSAGHTIVNTDKSQSSSYSFGNTINENDIIRIKVDSGDLSTNTEGLTATLMIAEP